MDIRSYNRDAWDRQVARNNPWTIASTPEEVARARSGELEIYLTPERAIPAAWLVRARDSDVLCLASGGGQQGPLLAAFGARVTVFDNSPAQLSRDREVALREGLALRTVEGDMRDLSMFADASFDLIVHPISNCFAEEVRSVWRECARVLRVGGDLLAGFTNPLFYTLDPGPKASGVYQIRFAIPYSDATSISAEERAQHYNDEPIEFGHTLEDQIGGQLDAGFVLTGFYEDRADNEPVTKLIPAYIATRAKKIAL